MAEQTPFKPEEHFRNLKGQQYLEVKWRVVWFRQERPDGYITTDLVEHDAAAGLAVFKARVGYYLVIGETEQGYPAYREVYATGYGSESRKDFNDYLEKAETKAIGRALAMLAYGTAQAIELDEVERIVDGPVERQPSQGQAQQKPKDTTARSVALQRAQDLLSRDPEARAKLPKPLEQQTDEEVQKTITWLVNRHSAAKKGETFWTGPVPNGANGAPQQQAAPTAPRADELTAYVNDVDAHLQSMKGTRGPMTAEQRGTWASLYTRGQALVGPATGEDSRPVAELKPTEIASACSRFVQSCLAELAGSEGQA